VKWRREGWGWKICMLDMVEQWDHIIHAAAAHE
jgi:hypothetical protein